MAARGMTTTEEPLWGRTGNLALPSSSGKLPSYPGRRYLPIRAFALLDDAFDLLVGIRWPHGIMCVHCRADRPYFVSTIRAWKCRKCGKWFRITTGTVMADSALPLSKWVRLMRLLAKDAPLPGQIETGQIIGSTQKTVSLLYYRLRRYFNEPN